MNDFLIAANAGGGLTSILMIVILFGLMYFMMIRPQRKAQQKKKEMMGAMRPGDAVVTIGGLHGVISRIDEQAHTVELDIEGVYLTFDIRAIGRVAKKGASAATTVDSAAPATSEAESDSSDSAATEPASSATGEEAKSDDKSQA